MRTIRFRVWDKQENKFFEPIYEAYNGNLLDLSITLSGELMRRTLEYPAEHESMFPNRYEIDQFTGLTDKNGKETYANDLLKDPKGVIFRIYATFGGFVMKAHYWKHNIKDLVATDELIYQPLSDPQTAGWIKDNCEVVGNIHEQNK